MRIVILLAGLLVVTLAGIGIYYSPRLLNLGNNRGNPSAENEQWKHSNGEISAEYAKVLAKKAADAQEHLVFESLLERLPKGKPISPTRALDGQAMKRWEALDGNLARIQDERAKLLKAYHEKTRQFFVSSPGMGAERGPVRENPDDILLGTNFYSGDPMQPGEAAKFPDSPNEQLSRLSPNEELYLNHTDSLSAFFYSRSFGLVKDREHVSGFKPHGFHYVVTNGHAPWRWQVQNVQLVGILQHEKPVVYLGDKLPSMELVRQGKTRPLDYFEQTALPALCEGEDLYIVSKDDTIRMLGAIRATKVCLQCHEAKIGDLLGAFSYTLRPAPKMK
jgi:hypothetical protein